MSHPKTSRQSRGSKDRRFWLEIARGFGGALLFAMPILMTMEIWWLGFYLDRLRLGILMTILLPTLVLLSRHFGWRTTNTWGEAVREALMSYAVGLVAGAVVLFLIGVLRGGAGTAEMVGKVAIQAIPGSIGAVVGASQFAPAGKGGKRSRADAGYGAELFFTFAGALYLAISVAPTEEMILIAYQMTYGHAVALALASLLTMHVLVYAIDFRRQHLIARGTPWWSYFLRFTVVGYAIALVVSALILWIFGRMDQAALQPMLVMIMVLGFPATLGAAAARLIL
jgi:putative integral membrane protein (TIGR02587 family)